MTEFAVLSGYTVAVMHLRVFVKTAQPVCGLILEMGFNLDNGSISNRSLTQA